MAEAADSGQATEAQAEAPQANGTQGLDALTSRIDELRESIPQMIAQAQQRDAQDHQEDDPDDPDYWDQLIAQYAGEDADDLQDPAQPQGQLPLDAIQKAVQQEIQKAIAPLHEWRLGQEADAIEAQYPELQDPKVQQSLIQDAQATARGLAAEMGNPEIANLARYPQFAELVFLASKARESASQEVPAGQGPEVTLEPGGGATPATPEEDPAARIVAARNAPLFGSR